MDTLEEYQRNGCAVVRNFASSQECLEMKAEMLRLAKDWDCEKESGVFRTDIAQAQTQSSDEYFFSSADKVHFFLEPDGKGVADLNKVGHALHVLNPIFRRYSNSDKIAKLVRSLGYKSPVLPQSMYILKQPKVGGQVTAHQDSSFLFTEPRQTCLGLWLALDDATLENGCLWYRPGSHVEPVRRHYVRTGKYVADFKQLVSDEELSPVEGMSWSEDETTNDRLRKLGFIPVPCGPGDLVLIHGQVEHLSLSNKSTRQRHTFQLHLVEGPAAGVDWSKQNWLQYPAGKPFPKL